VVPLHASSNITFGVVGDVAYLSCETGYIGSSAVTCLENGTWSYSSLVCEIVKCESAPLVPDHAYTVVTSGAYGDLAQLLCKYGYSGIETVSCKADGNWENYCLTCIPAVCEFTPDTPVHGFSNITSRGYFSDVAKIFCDNGYRVVCEGDDSDSGSAVEADSGCSSGVGGYQLLYCDADGTWIGPEPVCAPVSCPIGPALPPFGKTETNSGVFGDSAVLGCQLGYNGTQTVQCQADGTWSETTYTCEVRWIEILFCSRSSWFSRLLTELRLLLPKRRHVRDR
jgi:hypothetical protein